MPGYLPHRRTLTSLSHRFLEAFAVWRLTGQLRYLLGPETAPRALQPVRFHYHRRHVFKAREIAHFPFAGFLNPACRHMLSASRTNQLQARFLAPHPQLQLLGLLVNFLSINSISRPSQNARPVVFSHSLRLASDPPRQNRPIG